jgi:hypothetical protein
MVSRNLFLSFSVSTMKMEAVVSSEILVAAAYNDLEINSSSRSLSKRVRTPELTIGRVKPECHI